MVEVWIWAIVCKGDRRSRRRSDIVIRELVGVQPVLLPYLRHHFVGATRHAEIVHVAAAEHRREGIPDIAHVKPHLRDLVTIDLNIRLRLVILQIGVEKHKHAGLQRIPQKGLRDTVQGIERLRTADGELNRKPELPGKDGGWKTTTFSPANPPSCCCIIGARTFVLRTPLIPRLHDHTGKHRSRQIELEDMRAFGNRRVEVVDLFAVDAALLQCRVWRRIGDREKDALILFRCQFAFRRRIEEIDAAQHDRRECRGYRHIIEAAVQHAGIKIGDPLEDAIDKTDELYLPLRLGLVVPFQHDRTHHRRQGQGRRRQTW